MGLSLFRNIRFYILIFSLSLAAGIYFYIQSTVSTDTARIIKLTQIYALTAATFLYFTLLATPLTRLFTFLPFRSHYIHARRALGISAFLFASLHAEFAFFGELGGFTGLVFLNSRYLSAISLGAISIGILTIMAASSFEWVIAKVGYKRWKLFHRLIYLVAFLITIHALMLGSHFSDLSGMIPQIFSVALAFLLILESIRIDTFLSKRFATLPKIGPALFTVSILVLTFTVITFLPQELAGSLSLHETHKQLAKQSQTDLPSYLKNLPGMQGDRTKRFTVDADFPENIEINEPTTLKFRVFDASSGAPINFFTINYEKIMHLIVVDSSLNLYQHLHPEFKNGWFEIPVTFPKAGRYNLYLDFVPTGAIEQQIGFSLNAGNTETFEKPDQQLSPNSKQFGDYKIALKYNSPLKASELSIGAQNIDFEIYDKSGNPVTTLKPYLGSFGHMVMLNTESYEYSHVHPLQTEDLQPHQNGGPIVTFMPVGIYGPIKPGIYKLFAQFNPNNNLITADFTVKVE